jgi:hypothetical protein
MIEKYAESNDNRSQHSGLSSRLMSIWITAFVLLLLSAPGVLAQTDVDFYCSPSPSLAGCTGTVATAGSNFSTSGISIFNDTGPYSSSVPFTLVLNTATKTVSIVGTGAYLGQNLTGTILSFSIAPLGKTTTDYSFVANWPTLPAAVQLQLGTLIGQDSGFVIAMSGGIAESVDVLITPTPTPEPASMFLFGTGLLTIGAMIRRRSARKAAIN